MNLGRETVNATQMDPIEVCSICDRNLNEMPKKRRDVEKQNKYMEFISNNYSFFNLNVSIL